MSAGKRNRLVAIQRPLTTASDTGSRSVVWEHFTSVYGYKRDLPRGSEKTHSSTLYPIKQVQWVIRYTRGLTPAMRLVYTENERTEVWEIIAITDSDYNRSEMLLVCELRGQETGEAGSCPTLCEQIEDAEVVEIVGCLSELQEDQIKALLCPAVSPATYQNSDGTFTQQIDAGDTYTSPDITVTEADGSETVVPSNKDVTCEFPVIRARSTDGVYEAFELTSYPAGGNADLLEVELQSSDGVFGSFALRDVVFLPTVLIDSVGILSNRISILVTIYNIINTDGAILKTLDDYQDQSQLTVPDIPLTDDDGAVGNYPTPTSVVVDGVVNSASYASGVLTIEPASAPPSVIPNRVIPPFSSVIDNTGDLGWHWNAGTYNYNDGAGLVQELDPTAGAEYFFTLKYNNQFGNKLRFTDDQGVGGTTGRFDFQGDTVTPNSAGATPGYFIDHLTGLGFTHFPVASIKNWDVALALCHGFTLGSYSDFRMPNEAEYLSLCFVPGFIKGPTLERDLPFNRGGSTASVSFDPTAGGIILFSWCNRLIDGRGRDMQTFRLRMSDAPITTSTQRGAYAVRKHF